MLTDYVENRRHVLERNPNFHGETYPCEGEPGDREKGYLADCGKPHSLHRQDRLRHREGGGAAEGQVPAGLLRLAGDRAARLRHQLFGRDGRRRQEGEGVQGKGHQAADDDRGEQLVPRVQLAGPGRRQGRDAEQAERARKLRQALSIAIDWEEHIAIFERGQGVAAQGPLPPSLFGYRSDGPSAFNPVVYRKGPDGKPVRRSLDEAKKLLAEAGYPDGRDAKTGKPLVLNFDYLSAASPDTKAVLDWYTKQFAKIGVQLEIRATDYNRFQDKMNKGSFQIAFAGWLADYPDAENFLFMLYGPNSKALTNGNGENSANYSNAEFDRLYEQMKFLDDGPQKQKLIDQMIEIVQNDAVWSMGYFPTSAAAYQQWISNGKPTQIIRNHIGYLRLDPELRAQKLAEWNRPVWWPVPLILIALIAAIVPAWFAWRRRERETAARTLASAGATI